MMNNPIIFQILEIVKMVIVYPIKAFSDKLADNELLLKIKAMTTLTNYEGITWTMAMAVDEERKAPPVVVQDEVQKQVQQATKLLIAS